MREFLPEGSYRSRVRNAKVMLYCMARKLDGAWVPASLDLTHLDETNVANEDGYLVNGDGDAGRVGNLPGGSYLDSTRQRHAILSALCPSQDQKWHWRTLDITDLKDISTLSLIDGELKVDDHSTN